MCHLYLRFLTSLSLLVVALTANAQITILHDFGSVANDGSNPHTPLLLEGSTLFGTTLAGGEFGSQGALFSIGTNGSGYDLEHSFFTSTSGMDPIGTLAIDGTTLYGTTEFGGATAPFTGTVYSIGTDGSSPNILHEFDGGASDGARPAGGILRIGSTLYGITSEGGDDNFGTIFSIGTNGTGFTLLHEFAGDPNDGSTPTASLIFADGKLFGTTQGGGEDSLGILFSIDPNGSNYTVVHEFVEDINFERPDGAFPEGIVADGSTIYGVTNEGGADESGIIYKINTNGTGFSVIHEFEDGVSTNGSFPSGALAVSGTTLVGTTNFGGASEEGTVFSLETDGTDFQVLHSFAGGTEDGSDPRTQVTIDGSTILGTTSGGGDFGAGTIFSLPLGGGTLFREADFNEDTFVDEVDLSIWEAAYATNDTADADGDGDSDGADFLIWQQQFGLPPLLSVTRTAVPEPCALGLFVSLALGLSLCGRRRYDLLTHEPNSSPA